MVESFVVRVVVVARERGLVGEIEVVGSGHRMVFRSADELVRLLFGLTATPAVDIPPGPAHP